MADNVIVTGAKGFVGQSLVAFLSHNSIGGLAVSRRQPEGAPFYWEVCERNSFLNSRKLILSDAVVHLEVKQHVLNPTNADLEDFERVNVGGTQEWLDWCSLNSVKKFIHFSTIKAVESRATPIDETATGPSDTPYGASKWRAEEAVRKWCSEDPTRVGMILRPAVIYGPGNLANVYAMVDSMARGRFFIVGEGRNVKSLVSLRNVTAAVHHFLGWSQPGCHVFNLVDERSYTLREIAEMMSRALGLSSPPRQLPLLAARAGAMFGDIFAKVSGKTFPINSSRLKALLEETHFSSNKLLASGFKHPQTTEEGIRELVGWYREQRAVQR